MLVVFMSRVITLIESSYTVVFKLTKPRPLKADRTLDQHKRCSVQFVSVQLQLSQFWIIGSVQLEQDG